jgi:hypothetical protein
MLNTYMRRIDLISKLCAPVRRVLNIELDSLIWLAICVYPDDHPRLLLCDHDSAGTGHHHSVSGVHVDRGSIQAIPDLRRTCRLGWRTGVWYSRTG